MITSPRRARNYEPQRISIAEDAALRDALPPKLLSGELRVPKNEI
jgi:hypothetical protein